MSESVDAIINTLNRPFWNGAAEGRLVLPHCVATATPFWPPSPISPFADGSAVEWREVSATGTVLARVTYRRPFQRTFAGLLPYGIAMVALDCGPRLQAHVRAPDEPGAPGPGDCVTLCFETLLDGGPRLPVARPIPA
jgi:uncharacterized OB-fold protein